jgi:hypothetical protein
MKATMHAHETTDLEVGDTVDVLQAARLPVEYLIGTGTIRRITESASGERLYWIAGFPMARTASVLRKNLEAQEYEA